MDCPQCKQRMLGLSAPPASTIYICENVLCPMNDTITER